MQIINFRIVKFFIFMVNMVNVYAGFCDPLPYETYAHKLMDEFSKQMEREFGLMRTGDGGSMPYGVTSLDIHFVAFRKASIEDARALEICVIEKFWKFINSYEELMPYLTKYPIPKSEAGINIAFWQEEGKGPYLDGSVAYVFQAQDALFYYKTEGISKPDIKLGKEPYEIARNSVMLEHPEWFREDTRSQQLVVLDEVVEGFARRAEGEFGVRYSGRGRDLGAERPKVIFTVFRRATIDEARALEVQLTEGFVRALNEKSELGGGFDAKRVQVELIFLNKDYRHHVDGSVARVSRSKGGSIFYQKMKKEYGSFSKLKEESYEKARVAFFKNNLQSS